ncbi:MAG: lipid II flippase MurJ [Desulfovibrionaceae bacterium]|nr:lipid II flippase MurJ [Desulfovibrionaceae bacterium]
MLKPSVLAFSDSCLGTLLSRLLGFVRDALCAWLVGGSSSGDALSAALRIPFLFRRLYGEGTLSLPLTVLCSKEPSAQKRSRLAGAYGGWIVLSALLPSLFAMFFAEQLVRAIAPGLEAPFLVEAALLFRCALPYVFFAVLTSVYMSLMHSMGEFRLTALTPALFNIIVIAAAFLSFPLGASAALCIAIGVFLGGVGQYLLLRRKACVLFSLSFANLSLLRPVPYGLFCAAVPQITFLIVSSEATLLADGCSAAVFYAERILELPVGVLGSAVAAAAAPSLASMEKQREKLRERLHIFEKWTLMLTVPAACGIMILSRPVASLLFGRGAFDDLAVEQTATALFWIAPCLPAYALSRHFISASQILNIRGRTAMSGVCCLLAASGCCCLFGFFESMTMLAAPCSASIGLWLYVLLLRRTLRLKRNLLLLHSLFRYCLGNTAMIAVALLLLSQTASDAVSIAAASFGGAAAYAAFCIPEIRQVAQWYQHR